MEWIHLRMPSPPPPALGSERWKTDTHSWFIRGTTGGERASRTVSSSGRSFVRTLRSHAASFDLTGFPPSALVPSFFLPEYPPASSSASLSLPLSTPLCVCRISVPALTQIRVVPFARAYPTGPPGFTVQLHSEGFFSSHSFAKRSRFANTFRRQSVYAMQANDSKITPRRQLFLSHSLADRIRSAFTSYFYTECVFANEWLKNCHRNKNKKVQNNGLKKL